MLHFIQRTYHAISPTVQNMGINHGGVHIAVTEKFLYGKGFVYMPASFLTCQFVLPAVFLRKESLPFEFLLPEGYFESRALGRLTAPNPSSKSFWRIFLTSSICFFRFYLTDYMCLIQDAFPGIFFWIAIQPLLFILNGSSIFFSQERLFFLKKQP